MFPKRVKRRNKIRAKKNSPTSLYPHPLSAWLTRTLRSNVSYSLRPAETTVLYVNRQKPPPLCVEESQALLWLSPPLTRWQMLTASELLNHKSWFNTLPEWQVLIWRRPWRVYKPLRDSLQPLLWKLYMWYLITELFTLQLLLFWHSWNVR